MKTLNIGVFGVGGRGMIARSVHKPEFGLSVVAGADINPDNFKAFREYAGPDVRTTSDYRDLLSDPEIDVFFVTTPDNFHEEMAIAALKAGKAVYLEKPMAITIEGCDRVLTAAWETGAKLFIGHNMRYFPIVLKMKEIIDSGVIGDIQAGWCRHFVGYGGDAYFRDWHSERENGTGLLLQKGAHDIDVMHWLMGGYTERVVGMGMLSVYNQCERRSPEEPGCAKWDNAQWPPLEQTGFSPVIDVEDHNMVLMQLNNGKQASYMQCHYTPDSERNYTFIGTRGRIENIGDYGDCKVHVWTQRGPRETPDIVYHLKPVEGSHGGADPVIMKEFIEFVRNGAPTSTSPIAARNAVAAGVLAHTSMRTGCTPQDIPPVPEALLDYFANGQRR